LVELNAMIKRQYDFTFDNIKAPYNETGILKCGGGIDLVKWNCTTEPYLKLVVEE